MLHLLIPWNPIRTVSLFPKRPQHLRDTGPQPKWTANQCHKPFWIWVIVPLTLTLPIFPTVSSLAKDEPGTEPTRSEEDQKVLQNIHTILVTGTAQSWLDVPTPPYNAEVTLKLKLEDAGFQVVFDPGQSHDANLRIHYEEIPSGQFRVLEQATAIHYRMQLVHDRLGQIFSHQFDAEPNAIPIGSLYWGTISNLEEDPYYCFLGDLIREHLYKGQNDQDILIEVLLRPYTHPELVNAAGSRRAGQASVQQGARLNIIQGLGQGVFDTPEAREALWTLAKKALPNERGAAFTQLGKIGDRSFLPPLTALLEQQKNPEVRFAAEHALSLIESR